LMAAAGHCGRQQATSGRFGAALFDATNCKAEGAI